MQKMKRLKNSQAKQAAKQFISINYVKLFVHWNLLTNYSLELCLLMLQLAQSATFLHGGGVVERVMT